MTEIVEQYIVPVTKIISSLRQLACDALIDLAKGSSPKNEGDIQSVVCYFQDLPLHLRAELARSAQRRLLVPRDDHGTYEPLHTTPNFSFWCMTCFRPDEEDMTLTLLHVGFEHYSAKALQYLSSEACNNLQIKNTCLHIQGGWEYADLDIPRETLTHFKTMLHHCTNLTEVTLGALFEDSSVKAVGEWCTKLRELTLDRDHRVTSDGFIAFAESQMNNRCLQAIYLLCDDSPISLRGLAQVWLLPLHITKLQCGSVNFTYHEDSEFDELVRCHNGPSKLTDLTISWGYRSDIMAHSALLFPKLQKLHLKGQDVDLPKSGHVCGIVKSLQTDTMDILQVATCYPNIAILLINSELNSHRLPSGSFSHLVKFEHWGKRVPFDTFCSVMTEAKNVRIFIAGLSSQDASQYTDGPFCKLLRQTKHLENLEQLKLFTTCDDSLDHPEKIRLTEVSVSCILQTCKDIKVISNVNDWAINLDIVWNLSRGHKVVKHDPAEFDRNSFYDEKTWYSKTTPDFLYKVVLC